MSLSRENDKSFRRNNNIYYNISFNTSKRNNYSVSPISSKYKKIGNYIILKTIGSGTFSTVKLGLHLPTQQKVAIKILDKNRIKDENDIRRISREIHILSKLYHPNIAQLYETIWSENHIYIIMEYVEGDHLFHYINSLRRLSEIKASKLFNQLISCLEYIHILGVVHRDIKPENILLTKNKSKIKLVDFGLSNSYKYGTLLKTACGSPCYAPPEMISGVDYKPLYSDLWSCGVVLYCMLVGKLPFDDEDIKVLYKHIKSANFFIPKFLSSSAQDILKKILNPNPNKRIRIEDIKKHPFYLLGEKNNNNLDKGILIGLEEIPVNDSIVRKMKKLFFGENKKIDEKYIIHNIKNNYHNDITVIYYLMIKKLEGIKDYIHNKDRIKLINAENNIKNININYINDSELKTRNTINKTKIKQKLIEKNNLQESENLSENNYNIEENSRRGKGNILNISNIRKLIFNSNDISLKSKYNKDRFNVVVINNILTDNTPQNKTINSKSKKINYTLNNSNENKINSEKKTVTRRNNSFNYKRNYKIKERTININNTKSNKKNKKINKKINKEKINLKKINNRFNDIRQIDINKNLNNNINTQNIKVKNSNIKNKAKKISKIEYKTNRITNLKLGFDTYNTTTKREEKNDKKGINIILTNYNTRRDKKNFNISLIKRKAYNSNSLNKKKNVDIEIDKEDLIKENQKNKNRNTSYNKKIIKQKNNCGVLGSLINSKDKVLKDDLKKIKSKISYSKPKSKDKNNINNINIVLSINNDCLNINNNNNNKNVSENIFDLNRNNSCKNSEIQKSNKMKRLNYNFSFSNIKKKKIHLISQIRPKLYINKPEKINSKKKK